MAKTPPPSRPRGERNCGPAEATDHVAAATNHVAAAATDHVAAIAAQFGIDVLYAFGSRAREALAHLDGRGTFASDGASDLDLAALPEPGRIWSVDERVLMTAAFEEVFAAPRVDLIVLPEAPPFLALAAVSGELLFARDRVREANYQLYVLRRAGDLAPFERARRAHLLATTP